MSPLNQLYQQVLSNTFFIHLFNHTNILCFGTIVQLKIKTKKPYTLEIWIKFELS